MGGRAGAARRGRRRGGVCSGVVRPCGVLDPGCAGLVLERRQHVAVVHADEGVRVAQPRQVAERGQDARLQRRGEVEQPGASGTKAVGQQVPVRGHLVLGVMRVGPRLAGGQRRDNRAVAGGGRRGVDDAEEVARFPVGVAGPEEEIRRRVGGRRRRRGGCAETAGEHESGQRDAWRCHDGVDSSAIGGAPDGAPRPGRRPGQ